MKRLVVLGGGESGVGTALLGKEKGLQFYFRDILIFDNDDAKATS